MQKPIGYYSFMRQDVLPYIPDDAKTILSLGCGTAETEGKFRQSHDCHITGIEIFHDAAEKAQKNIDCVIESDVSDIHPQLKDKTFDCILALDVLEHLDNPWFTLKEYVSLLKPTGVVIASIPNINHTLIRYYLSQDRFPYVPAGILDYTHVRFFTLTEIYALFACAGLKIIRVNHHETRNSSIQYIVTGLPVTPRGESAVATVVLLTLNNLYYTRQCVDSLRRNTRVPYRLVIVDNGSTDGTLQYLEQQKNIIHIPNLVNIGFSAGFNQVLRYVTTPYVVISNNDVLFTPNWLEHLIAHAARDPSVGIVGPVSNNVSGPQKLTSNINWSTINVDDFGQLVHKAHQGNSQPFHRIVFFCALIKMQVLEQVGFLDERFINGMFEDDDYCLRAAKAGFKLLIANDTFIYHYGSQTFRSEKMNFEEIMTINRKLFCQKWGITQ